MPRFLPAALVLCLLVATGLSFIYTELLKLEPSPIRRTKVDSLISPICNCPTARARISFQLRKADVVTVSIVDTNGHEVRRIATSRPAPRAQPLRFFWNGRVAGGKAAPEGAYRPRVRLELLEKTIVLPNEIRIDTTRPKVAVLAVQPRTISPDRDGRADRVAIGYSLDEPAQASLYVNGYRRVLGNGLQRRGRLVWSGRLDGEPVRPGSYRLAVVAVDEAGNRSRPAFAGTVRVRYIAVEPDAQVVFPGGVVRVSVATDAESYRWRLGTRSGTTHAHRLVLRAPVAKGRYVLVVEARGHDDRTIVRVRPRAK